MGYSVGWMPLNQQVTGSSPVGCTKSPENISFWGFTFLKLYSIVYKLTKNRLEITWHYFSYYFSDFVNFSPTVKKPSFDGL
jgi:hypothetical protein